jgi:hypothetical protein
MQFNQRPWSEKFKWLQETPEQLWPCVFQIMLTTALWGSVVRNRSRKKAFFYVLLFLFTAINWVSAASLTARKRIPLLLILPLCAAREKEKTKGRNSQKRNIESKL